MHESWTMQDSGELAGLQQHQFAQGVIVNKNEVCCMVC